MHQWGLRSLMSLTCRPPGGMKFLHFAPTAGTRHPVRHATHTPPTRAKRRRRVPLRCASAVGIYAARSTQSPRHEERDAPLVVDGSAITPEQRTVPFAIAPIIGGPAITIRLNQGRDGLPISVLLVGRRWDDERLLVIAERLAEVSGGYRQPPGF